ncbi:MAG: ketoglutarate semialdehyde dehydrogenase [Pirellulaceae bacterium]|nr:MAG: ketoglutarate semialdehyde dehydrogenase [Pirellulaceae bacterium]
MCSDSLQPVLVAGQWRPARAIGAFQAVNPATGEPLPERYPISDWADCDEALEAAVDAAEQLRRLPPDVRARFLEVYADLIDQNAEAIVQTAHLETALPVRPRLLEVELPRTTNQLRQAAAAARDGSWALPTLDTQLNIRSHYAPIGPVCVFGPNNFPLAFGSISGGDFAAAIAAGNPVLAKAHSSHPRTTQAFAELAVEAAHRTGFPKHGVQLLYRLRHEDGLRLVADRRVGATGYTGSRAAGLALKHAADAAGKPIYLELSSINPVVVLPGALEERSEKIVAEFTTSCLMGTGQFCTNPGLVLLLDGDPARHFVESVKERFRGTPPGYLLSAGVLKSLEQSIARLRDAGAELLVGGQALEGPGFRFANTLLCVGARRFCERPEELQTEAFGNVSLFVMSADLEELKRAIQRLEGNLTGSIYSATDGSDDALYEEIEPLLRQRVGRLLNDKMPTGVAVTAAMNHGGPYPATGHPGFTAVGIPASLRRFAALHCYDNVRPERLPKDLRDEAPNATIWRWIDGRWKQG